MFRQGWEVLFPYPHMVTQGLYDFIPPPEYSKKDFRGYARQKLPETLIRKQARVYKDT